MASLTRVLQKKARETQPEFPDGIAVAHAPGWERAACYEGKDGQPAWRSTHRGAKETNMRQFAGVIRVQTRGRGLTDVTRNVVDWVEPHGLRTGLLTLLCRHTSASLIIQENAAPAVRSDLEAFFDALAPEDPGRYFHNDEGPDDMPAHIRAALTGVNLSIPVIEGRLALGTWQGIYLFEHRRAPHRREIAAHAFGE